MTLAIWQKPQPQPQSKPQSKLGLGLIVNSKIILTQSYKNYFFIFWRRKASFYSKSRSSPLILYIINKVTPTYHTINKKPYPHILTLTSLDFSWGSSYSENLCLAYNYYGFGMGPPLEKSLFFTVCPLKFFFSLCSLGGNSKVVSNLLSACLTVSLSLFITIK